MSAKKIKQNPKPRMHPTGSGGKVQTLTSFANPQTPKSGGKIKAVNGQNPKVAVRGKTAGMRGQNPMPPIREYPGEGRGAGARFGAGVKIIGKDG